MVKPMQIPICQLRETEKDIDRIFSSITGEYEHAQQRRRADKVLGPSGLPIESVAAAKSVFAKEIPIRSAYARRKRALLSNSRFGAYGLPYDVMEYLYKRRMAIAELFGAPVSAVADVRFQYDHEHNPYLSSACSTVEDE